MSATNRQREDGTSPGRIALDDYPTPAWCLDRLYETGILVDAGERWVEPCAGAGNIIRAIDAYRPGLQWDAVERQSKYLEQLEHVVPSCGVAAYDFRVWAKSMQRDAYDVAITNPPFSIAGEILEACQRCARVTVLLLRVGFLESAERAEMHRKWMPHVLVLPDRPQFVHGQSDNAAYAWMIWDRRRQRRTGKIVVLRTTPLEKRRPCPIPSPTSKNGRPSTNTSPAL